MIDIEKDNTIHMTPCKWSFEERILFNIKNNRCFEKSYSKWATFEINGFNDFTFDFDFKRDGVTTELHCCPS